MKIKLLIFGFLLASSLHAQELLTRFETSDFKACATYEEVVAFCTQLADNYSEVNYDVFGKSARMHDLPLLVVDKDGLSNPEAIRETGRSILMVEASIHPGEPDGTSAGMMFVRDLLQKPSLQPLLENVSVVFLPVFNVDGYLRRGPHNRINQDGPDKMGWRVTADNLNLNRDFLRSESVEMKAWHKMFDQWMPDFFIDCHTTDGADYQYAITYDLQVYGNMSDAQTEWLQNEYLEPLKVRMKADDYPMFRYVSFRNWHDPESGLEAWVSSPMLSQGYTAVKNRPGLLVETHMMKPYEVRVKATYQVLVHSMELMHQHGEDLSLLNRKADMYTASENFRDQPYALSWEASDEYREVDFLGIEYSKETSGVTGGTYYKYGDKEVVHQMKFYDDLNPDVFADVPEACIIPPEWENVIERLDIHGITYRRIQNDTSVNVRMYRLEDVEFASRPFEGAFRVQDFTPDTLKREYRFPAHSVFVPLDQKYAKVILHLLDPAAPSSLLKWGFFNAVFEQKEYAEIYVMEQMVPQMLEDQPELKTEFEAWMKANPELEGQQWQIMNWFYQHTPYWDDKKDLYPVGFVF